MHFVLHCKKCWEYCNSCIYAARYNHECAHCSPDRRGNVTTQLDFWTLAHVHMVLAHVQLLLE